MKVAILAGGFGTRIAEETEIKPKPMVEIGGQPLLWHIMMHYAEAGHREFVIALGYRGEYVKRWASEFVSLHGNLRVRTGTSEMIQLDEHHLDWTVDLIDTGLKTATGGRLKRLKPWLGDSTFMLTWGDGVSNVDLKALLAFHQAHGKLATLTAARPPARFGHLEFEGDSVSRFTEKPQTAEGWINGGFFVLEPGVFEYIDNDETPFERQPLEQLAADGQLMAYRHTSFWQCMDTLRDKKRLEQLWEMGNAPWKCWS
jgi:glucose-1-phosphate cytidylyltransferase